MKFTKEQALESLKGELTNKGRKPLRMSEKSLDKLTDTLLGKFADDETGLPEFIEAALEVLNPFNDNIGKEKSDFIKKWNEEHPQADPEEKKPENGETSPKTENPELAALKAEIEALKQERETEKKQRAIADVRKSLAAKMAEKGIKDEKWVSDILAKVNVTEETDIEAEADDFLKIYNKSVSHSGSIPPANPASSPEGIPDALKEASKMAEERNKTLNNL